MFKSCPGAPKSNKTKSRVYPDPSTLSNPSSPIRKRPCLSKDECPGAPQKEESERSRVFRTPPRTRPSSDELTCPDAPTKSVTRFFHTHKYHLLHNDNSAL